MGKFKNILICIIVYFFYMSISNIYAKIDWSRLVVESTMFRQTASQLGSWTYHRGFYLYGQYRVWQRIGDDKYFQYIKEWLDEHIDENGNIDRSINSLDNMQSGLITLYCFEETGEHKYKLAADKIRQVFDTYPRTSDGGFWHGTGLENELWLDGVYMSLPFLIKYGQLFGDSTYCYDEVANQIIIYASHLKDSTGLLYHAYDEDGSSAWADPVTHHSPEFWGRSMGWFGMAIIEILEILPTDHPKQPDLIQILKDLIEGLAQCQDTETGLWYQVTNKGDREDNWHETSCSCMYTFFFAKAVEKGYVDSSYIEVAKKGYAGVLTKISIGSDSLTYLVDISQGTSVGDYNYYINRNRNVNDLHGLGAFLLVNEVMAKYDTTSSKNTPPSAVITFPDNQAVFTSNSDIQIQVNSIDYDGKVVKVEFYEGEHLLSTDMDAPWEYIWSQVPAGQYTLSAVAYDDSNASTISSPIHIIVSDHVFILEAEDAFISEGSIDSDHAGFTGTGFVNYVNKVGSYIEWTLDVPKEGYWKINFRYGNGSVNNRPCEIRLNTVTYDSSFDFESTGSWENWCYSPFLENYFTQGTHILRSTAITSEGGPNIDHLRLISIDTTASSIQSKQLTGDQFILYPNYPNPFNMSTSISYYIPKDDYVKLTVYNINGQLVDILIDDYKAAGYYLHRWIVKNNSLSSGIYYAKLHIGQDIKIIKMLLIQ